MAALSEEMIFNLRLPCKQNLSLDTYKPPHRKILEPTAFAMNVARRPT
jgi:hypothetical protein